MTESTHESLLRLGGSVADAVHIALRSSTAHPVSVDEVTALLDYESVEAHVRPGYVVVDASSVDGAAGRSLLLLTPRAARALLADAAGERPADDPEPEARGEHDPPPATPSPSADTSPLAAAELASIAELVDDLNTAAARALGVLLGQQVRYEPAGASMVEDPRFVVRPGPVQAICATMRVRDEHCRLIQFAPTALVMRAARAFEDLAQDAAYHAVGDLGTGPSAQSLGEIGLRVWAELGRAELGLADALALPLGAVVELDRDADAPVDLVVNGMPFGVGHLTITDDGEWALVLDEVGPARLPDAALD